MNILSVGFADGVLDYSICCPVFFEYSICWWLSIYIYTYTCIILVIYVNVYLVFWGPKTWLTKERCPIVRIMVYHLVERTRDRIQSTIFDRNIKKVCPSERWEATNRVCEPNPMDFPLVIDFLWSDPKGANGYGPSTRVPMVYTFGPDVAQRFLQANNLKYMLRSHETKSAGWQDWKADADAADAEGVEVVKMGIFWARSDECMLQWKHLQEGRNCSRMHPKLFFRSAQYPDVSSILSGPLWFDHPVDSPFSAPGDHSQRYHCLQCTELHRPRRKHGSCSSSHQSGGELGQAAPWPPKIGQFTLYIHHKCALPWNFARLHIWIYVPWKHGAISSRGQTCGLHPEHEFWKTLTPEVCPISASTSSRHWKWRLHERQVFGTGIVMPTLGTGRSRYRDAGLFELRPVFGRMDSRRSPGFPNIFMSHQTN